MKRIHWGLRPQVSRRDARPLTGFLAGLALAGVAAARATAAADPTPPDAPRPVAPAVAPIEPDAPARSQPIALPAAPRAPSWDLDGTYLWLGPIGAASHLDATWDSTFGGEAALVVVHERARLGLLGVDVGAARWTARGGGHVWVDGLIGTHLLGRMMGASLGPIVELSDLARPRLGGSIGVWAFAGITPYARLGAVANLGMFAELGVHIALPVLRR